MLKFFKILFRREGSQTSNTNSTGIKKGSVVKDKNGKYCVVQHVMDGQVFINDGNDWYGLTHILKYCKTIPISDVTLVQK